LRASISRTKTRSESASARHLVDRRRGIDVREIVGVVGDVRNRG
jgi:hypothetical protein